MTAHPSVAATFETRHRAPASASELAVVASPFTGSGLTVMTPVESSKLEPLRHLLSKIGEDLQQETNARYLPGSQFTIQSEGVRRRFVGMPNFVTTRGGAYFFMPGIAGVRYLASAVE